MCTQTTCELSRKYGLYLRGLDGNREITVRAVRRVSLMGVKTEPKAKFSLTVTIEAELVKAIQHRADDSLMHWLNEKLTDSGLSD